MHDANGLNGHIKKSCLQPGTLCCCAQEVRRQIFNAYINAGGDGSRFSYSNIFAPHITMAFRTTNPSFVAGDLFVENGAAPCLATASNTHISFDLDVHAQDFAPCRKHGTRQMR